MKKTVLLLFSLFLLTACTSQKDVDSNKSIEEQPLSAWIKLDNDEKNTLMIEALNEAGLEKRDWREHFRTVIKALNSAAVKPETRDMPIQQALEIQVKNVRIYSSNDK